MCPTENNNETVIRLDLSTIGGLMFAGRPRGKAVRHKFNLDEVDKVGDTVEIVFPDNMRVLSSSFVLGLLGESINFWGSKEEFLKHYKFSIVDRFKPTLDQGIEKSLAKYSGLMAN